MGPQFPLITTTAQGEGFVNAPVTFQNGHAVSPAATTIFLNQARKLSAFNHLSRRWQELLVMFLIIQVVLVVGCNSAKLSGLQKDRPISQSNAYSLALQQAKDNASSDELESIFKGKARLSLSGQNIKSLSILRVKQDSTLLVVDNERRVAESYGPSGTYTGTVGEVGNGPGKQLWPSDVIEVANQSVAVSDFQGHRVNIFANDGQFRSSFIYTPQNFSAQRMVYDAVNGCFFLFGNRWQTSDNGEISGADLLHKYDQNGQFIASYFPFPDKAKSLDLYSFNSPAMDLSDGVLYIALPFDYTIYRLDKSGEMKALFQGANTAFKEPTVKLETEKIPREDAYNYVQTWRLGWTPILALARINDHLVIEYQTFDKLRYTIDVWSLPSGNIVKSIKTNHLLLTRGADGYIYFLDNLENRGQSQYEILQSIPQF